MSGTAPNNPAPGSHASDRGVEQTPLDANQHGQAQNIIDETKDTHGSAVDRNIGESIDAANAKSALSSRVDEILNKSSSSSSPAAGSGTAGAERKATSATEQGFRVGEEADLHHLASSKQP
ncbi:hypothetical protein CGCSCA4_v010027 [Colletotrichum siamense]|uniref:Uncharacterized protein n=1 Tax=Colletotrichum siamense TaxID=690259 RepID=A0A9P5EPR7_COLSI|nr:hypothetical protein CGCSCA4_v010027 [Colletotrichum siamense]KAF4857480.1 hypothetical protein CGCSCA2_v008254 [Colletotrichum siamense]